MCFGGKFGAPYAINWREACEKAAARGGDAEDDGHGDGGRTGGRSVAGTRAR